MSPTIRRLMKEAAELSESSPSPSPHFCAHPVSDSNLFDWHFTLAGPPAPSPYAGGIYHGRIVLPPTYPLRPPSFRFLTPSGRFEVNREICLSISGHHEETWQPAWGIRTALTAIRSFMDGDAKGQLGGLDAPEDVRRMWAEKSRTWSCECMNGKTNEQILDEWRAICSQKGISVDDQDRETVPEELRMSYKKNSEEGQPQSSSANATDINEDSTAPSSEGGGNPATAISSVQREPSTLIDTPICSPQVSPSSETNTSTTVPQPTPTATVTTTTSTITSHNSTIGRPVNTQTTSSQDGPWLDRAIVGVLLALIFMIMRRIAASEDI